MLDQRHGFYYRRSELFQVLESHNDETVSQAVGSKSAGQFVGYSAK